MGNTCSTGRAPDAVPLENLLDLKLNQELQIERGCGPDIFDADFQSVLYNRGFRYPDNGEFTWGAKGGSCQMCSDPISGYGCDECQTMIPGRRPQIKRIAYKGDPMKCCMSGSVRDGNSTCDPQYSKLALGGCDSVMEQFCVQGDNIKSQRCRDWLDQRKDKRAWYDAQVEKYCSLNKNDTTGFCACYNLPFELTSNPNFSPVTAKPSCYYAACSSGDEAWMNKTMEMISTSCPTVQICNQNVTVGSMTSSKIGEINLSCEQENKDENTTNPKPDESVSSTNTNTTTPAESEKPYKESLLTEPKEFSISGINQTYLLIMIVIIIISVLLSSLVLVS